MPGKIAQSASNWRYAILPRGRNFCGPQVISTYEKFIDILHKGATPEDLAPAIPARRARAFGLGSTLLNLACVCIAPIEILRDYPSLLVSLPSPFGVGAFVVPGNQRITCSPKYCYAISRSE
jgi:hypothetical protein